MEQEQDDGKRDRLIGKCLLNAFTTDKQTLYLSFEPITLKISFFRGEAFFQSPDVDKLQKKNRLGCLKELTENSCFVTDVISYPYDRQFVLKFSNGFALYFLLFGKFSQIALYQDNENHYRFPLHSKAFDVNVDTQGFIENLLSKFDVNQDFRKQLPFLSVNQADELNQKGFLEADDSSKLKIIEGFRKSYLSKTIYVNKEEKKYSFSYAPNSEISSFDSCIDALDNFSRLYISHQVFIETKANYNSLLNRDLKALRNKEKSLNRKLEALSNSKSFREKADLLMAYMHLVKKGEKNVMLQSFDDGTDVAIRLNSKLTPQANAERYYRKAKNESRQIDFVLQNLAAIKKKIIQKLAEIETFSKLENFKEIVKKSTKKDIKKGVRLPYRTTEIDGYEIRIGRGAKDNDELLRSYTSKNDVWLHAKSVSGSHVIIRNPSKKKVNSSTVEKAAELAAFYSKSKNESLAAVMYTERKFVRKPKGATPGLVKVDKEEVLLVVPKALNK